MASRTRSLELLSRSDWSVTKQSFTFSSYLVRREREEIHVEGVAHELAKDLHAEVARLALHPQVVRLDELLVAAVVAQNDVVATFHSGLRPHISFSRGVMAT